MSGKTSAGPKSFRLSASTLARLEAASARSNENRNSMVERLLDEALRREEHPLIHFRTGAAGLREPWIVGTRWKVRQFVPVLRDYHGDVAAVAADFHLRPAEVQAAVSYYAEFREEVDEAIADNEQFEEEAHAQWEREQAVFK